MSTSLNTGNPPEPSIMPSTAVEHPLFCDATADYVLRSKEGVLFKTFRLLLRLSSGFFRDMFALDASSHVDGDSNDIPTLGMDDDADTIEAILRIVTSMPIKPITSLDVAEPLIAFCDKYSMEGTMSVIRASIRRPECMEDSLRLYKLACRYGWDEEAQLCAPLCLRYNLTSPETIAALQGISFLHYARLLSLVERRCTAFKHILDDVELFNGSSPAYACPACHAAANDLSWKWLRSVLVQELRECPSGDSIRAESSTEWPAMGAMYKAQHCGKLLYMGGLTRTKVIESLNLLPTDLI